MDELRGGARVTAAAAITGTGLATALGANLSETWEALLAGKYITDHARARFAGDTLPAGRAATLAVQVARQAIASAGWDERVLRDDGTALVLATSKGAMERWMAPLLHIDCSPYVAGGLNPAGLGEVASIVAREVGLGWGPRLTISAACASGLAALIRGAIMIESGEAARVLVIGTESSLHPLFLSSFRRLGVLAKAGGCRPMDRDRDGFVVSEAAAGICLERARDGAVCIERYAIAGDATHITAGDPSGQTLRRIIGRVVGDDRVDLVHAHATGTKTHDAVELAVLEELAGDHRPLIYSHKGALGHSLGAAGLVAVALNERMHRMGVVPPNVQTRKPLAMSHLILADGRRHNIRRSIAVAAGFGGAMAAVTLVSG